MRNINQRISKIEVLLQKVNFLVSNVKENNNEITAREEFHLIQSYIAELYEISNDNAIPEITQQSTQPPVVVVQEKTEKIIKKVESSVTAPPKAEEKVIASENGEIDQPTLNELLKDEQKDLSDTVVESKIADLKTAIDINQKFAYINELFNGDVDSFTQALSKLNEYSSFDEAEHYLNIELKNKYDWDDENEELQSIRRFIKRRYL